MKKPIRVSKGRRVIEHTRQVSARIGDFQALTKHLARQSTPSASGNLRCQFVTESAEPGNTPDTDDGGSRTPDNFQTN